MWTLTERQKSFAVFSFVSVVLVLLLAAHPLHAQTVTATIPAGTVPYAVAINPATNKSTSPTKAATTSR